MKDPHISICLFSFIKLGGHFCFYLNNGINRTGFLAEAAVDAFGHVDVIARGPPAAIGSSLSLNSDSLRSIEKGKGSIMFKPFRFFGVTVGSIQISATFILQTL